MTAPSPPGWHPEPPKRTTSTGLVVGAVVGAVALVLALVAGGVLLLRSSVAGGDADVLSGAAPAEQEQEQEQVDEYRTEQELAPPYAVPTRESSGQSTAGPCTYRPASRTGAPKVPPPGEKDVATTGTYEVVLDTSQGRISFVADAAQVPCTLAALRSLAAADYFDGSDCHRLTTEGIFVLQCGDPSGSGSGGPGYEYDDEALPPKLQSDGYPRGTVAMANAGPGTTGSQFFLVYRDAPLPANYTVVGRITAGLDVLDRVAEGGAGIENGSGDGRPRTPVELRDVTVSPA